MFHGGECLVYARFLAHFVLGLNVDGAEFSVAEVGAVIIHRILFPRIRKTRLIPLISRARKRRAHGALDAIQ